MRLDADRLYLRPLTQADVTAFLAERLARGLQVDTAAVTPRLRAHCARLLTLPPFAATEPSR